jgi:integration host factor subunit beta
MLKSQLIDLIAAENTHLYRRDLENVVNTILGEIAAALSRGQRVELRGFGVFSVKRRRARIGRNPRSGAIVAINRKFFPNFKTSKEMHKRLNGPHQIPKAVQ